MADERQINETRLNGQQLMTTRGDTVATDNLMEEETATNRAGAKIVGEYKGAPYDEAYLISDPIGSIEEEDYVPFNDISDAEQPKKKVLFADMIEKLRTEFPSAVSPNGTSEIGLTDEVLYLKNNQIDASMTDNNVSKLTYPSTSTILDRKGRTIMRTEAYVDPNGEIGWKSYVNNFDTDGHLVAEKGMRYHMKKSGELYYVISDPRAFRKAIDNIDQLGTSLPRGTVIDDYHTDSYTGTYYFADDGVASQITTLPESLCGKLIVMNNGNGGFSQYYIPNHSVKIWVRVWWSGAWSAWANIASGSKPHTYDSGTLIPNNSNINTYTTAGVYHIATTAGAETMTNLPVARAGNLIVIRLTNSAANYRTQIYYVYNDAQPWLRNTTDGGTTWSAWKQSSSGEHTYEMGTEIPENANLNTYTTAGVYQCELTATARTMSNLPYTGDDRLAFKLIVMKDRKSANLVQWYIPYDSNPSWVGSKIAYRTTDDGGSTWRDWMYLTTIDKVHFLEEIAPDHRISSNQDLNSFTQSGTWQCSQADVAVTLSNCPVSVSFKLVVDRQFGNSASEITQRITCLNSDSVGGGEWYRTKKYNSSTWGEWIHTVFASNNVNGNNNGLQIFPIASNGTRGVIKWNNADNTHLTHDFNDGTAWVGSKTLANLDDIVPPTIGGGYAVATVSGTAITATISGYKLVAGGIVSIKINNEMSTACTLNISNTGAKNIKFWNDEDPTFGKYVGGCKITTFIYDGTYYRVISSDRTPTVNPQSYVADTSGNVLLDWGYGINRAQLKYGIGTNKLAWNYYKNSAWRGDVTVADYYDIVHQYLGLTIPDNSNLNDYKTNGIYKISTIASAQTISNVPYSKAGKLIVMRIGGTQYVTQYYLPYFPNDRGRISYRSIDTGASSPSWSAWYGLTEQSASGVIRLATSGTTAQNNYVGIKASIEDTTTGQTFTYDVLKVYQDHQATPVGLDLVFEGGGNTFICGGDGGTALYPLKKGDGGENLYLLADGNIFLEANSQTVANRQGFRVDTNGAIIPVKAEALTDNFGAIGESSHKLANLWVYKINGASASFGDYLPLSGGTLTGYLNLKSSSRMIASGAYMPSVNTTLIDILNELRYSNGAYGSFNLKTAYTLSNTTVPTGWYNYFYIPHRVGGQNWAQPSSWDVDNVNYGTLLLFGMNNGNGMFRLRMYVNSGTVTVSELTDMHKGNCYIGACATAADERAKVATVDADFALKKGVRVAIKFSNTNTYSSSTSNPVTLNVNSTGAKNIWYNNTHSGSGNTGTFTKVYGLANRYNYYIYDGTYWAWDGCGVDDNSTNFLRNDASSTLTASAPQLRLKNSDINAQASDNGITTTKYSEYQTRDKNDLILSDYFTEISNTGKIGTFMQVRNYNGSTSAVGMGNFGFRIDKSGNVTYQVDAANNFNAATGIGYGTCSTAADQRVKAVTLANFVLVVGGIIGVKFTNTNTYSATADNKVCLNVNGTGEKPIYYGTGYPTGTHTTAFGYANKVHYYMYDGTNWVWLNHGQDNDGNNRKSFYGTCATAADQQIKVVSLADTNGWELRAGTIVGVKFSNTNTFSSQTATPVQLNVNNTGAKNIWYGTTHSGAGNTGTNTRIYGEANRVFTYMYDGTYWVWLNCGYEADTVDPRNLGFGYGTCETAESTTAKVVTLGSYNLRVGGYVTVYFKYAVPASATMNINSKGAKNIYYRGSAITANQIKAGDRATFIYDGTNYQLIGVDRDNYLVVNYSYSDSTGTPSYVSDKVSELKIPEFKYVIEGDVVSLSMAFKWDSAKTYPSGSTKLFKLNYSPRQLMFWGSNHSNVIGFIDTDGSVYIRSNTINAGTYAYVQITYLKA